MSLFSIFRATLPLGPAPLPPEVRYIVPQLSLFFIKFLLVKQCKFCTGFIRSIYRSIMYLHILRQLSFSLFGFIALVQLLY